MLVSRLWEERRLAYPIGSHRKGTYWLTYFKLDPSKLTTLNRECQLNEAIVRSLVLKIDPRIIDTLVAHALASPADAARARRTEAPAPVAAARDMGVEVPEDLGN
jgi:small subunit ribosomal protein S6